MNETRSILLRVVINELSRQYPELLPSAVSKPDYIRYATASDSLKLTLLSDVYEKHGAEAVLNLGFGIKNTGFSPILDVFLAAKSPLFVLKRWTQIEEKCKHRFRIQYKESPDRNAIAVRHFALYGNPAKLVESLLICGVQIAIFEAVGCQDVRCILVADDDSESLAYGNGQFIKSSCTSERAVFQWRFEWSSFARAENRRTSTHLMANLLADYDDPLGIITAVLSVLSEDISRHWKICEVASKLRMSKRTLQRYLNYSNVGFSLLRFAARIHDASKLLSGTDLTITEISHQCGFSDSAHFSRHFYQSTGLPPSKYRAISLTS